MNWPAPDSDVDRLAAGRLDDDLPVSLPSDLTPEQCRRLADYYLLDALLWHLSDEAAATDGEQGPSLARPTIDAPRPKESAPAPILAYLSGASHGAAGYFSSGWPVAYLIATVIFGIGLLVGSVVPVSQPVQLARQSAPLPSIVGQITGMVDCRWAENPKSEIRNPKQIRNQKSEIVHPDSLVALGDRFALASGLMEITYDTGAKVILQGPVTYEAESNGGYLSLGRLTGRLEAKTQAPRPKTADPSSVLLPPSCFVIRTPTVTVTDLGTEFGVEVARNGNTASHVYRGSVQLRVNSSNGSSQGVARVLYENQSACVDRASPQDAPRITIARSMTTPTFVREISRPAVTRFDLADVVAGGDGFSGRRGRGIDPASGQPTDSTLAAPKNADVNDCGRFRIASDGKYHRVAAIPYVDGVFIPDGHSGGVQVDSAGHRFSEFSTACNATAGNIWSGGVVPVPTSSMPPNVAALLPSMPPSHTLAPTKLGPVDYASKSHALIFLPANNGITFDLDAIRRASPALHPVRFRATAGNTEIASEHGLADAYADLWVLVDGQVRFRRREINKYSGVFPIALPIAKEDRFLTLVATDGGHDIGFGWILFGDPRLELATTATEGLGNPPPKQPGEKRR